MENSKEGYSTAEKVGLYAITTTLTSTSLYLLLGEDSDILRPLGIVGLTISIMLAYGLKIDYDEKKHNNR